MQCVCAILSSVSCPALHYFSTTKKGINYEKKKKELLRLKCVLIFSTSSFEIFLILRVIERDVIKITWNVSTDKHSNIFHENPFNGRRDVPFGQTGKRTDRHDEANSRFSQFCEPAWKYSLKKCTLRCCQATSYTTDGVNNLRHNRQGNQSISTSSVVIQATPERHSTTWQRSYSISCQGNIATSNCYRVQ
jgi:hypothetical protein